MRRSRRTGGTLSRRSRLVSQSGPWILTAFIVLIVGCETTSPTAVSHTPPVMRTVIVAPAVTDVVMGEFSPLARHVVIALRDSTVRAELSAALRSQGTGHAGIDLLSCSGGSLASRLMQAGERRGGMNAASACAILTQRRGGMLYMSPHDIAAWDPSTIPNVAAVANPNATRAVPTTAYRSPDRMVDLTDPKFQGPVLFVLPYVHASRLAQATPVAISTRTVFGPDVVPAPGIRGPGAGAPTNLLPGNPLRITP